MTLLKVYTDDEIAKRRALLKAAGWASTDLVQRAAESDHAVQLMIDALVCAKQKHHGTRAEKKALWLLSIIDEE